MYYAQIKVRGWIGQVPLHGETVAEAVAARQVLKMEIKSGEFLTPPELKENEEKDKAEKVSIRTLKDLKDAAAKHQSERETLAKKDLKTGKREDNGLKQWLKWKPQPPIVSDTCVLRQ